MQVFEATTAPRDGAGHGGPASSGRRRFVQVLLGGGLLASAASFIYPVLRYLVPPAATDWAATPWWPRASAS